MPLACCLDECDLVNFLEGRQTTPYAIERGLAEELHAFLLSKLANFRAGLLIENHFTDRIGEVKQLMDRRSSTIAGAAAFDAACALAEIECAPLCEIEATAHKRVFVVVHGSNTILADGA